MIFYKKVLTKWLHLELHFQNFSTPEGAYPPSDTPSFDFRHGGQFYFYAKRKPTGRLALFFHNFFTMITHQMASFRVEFVSIWGVTSPSDNPPPQGCIFALTPRNLNLWPPQYFTPSDAPGCDHNTYMVSGLNSMTYIFHCRHFGKLRSNYVQLVMKITEIHRKGLHQITRLCLQKTKTSILGVCPTSLLMAPLLVL